MLADVARVRNSACAKRRLDAAVGQVRRVLQGESIVAF